MVVVERVGGGFVDRREEFGEFFEGDDRADHREFLFFVATDAGVDGVGAVGGCFADRVADDIGVLVDDREHGEFELVVERVEGFGAHEEVERGVHQCVDDQREVVGFEQLECESEYRGDNACDDRDGTDRLEIFHCVVRRDDVLVAGGSSIFERDRFGASSEDSSEEHEHDPLVVRIGLGDMKLREEQQREDDCCNDDQRAIREGLADLSIRKGHEERLKHCVQNDKDRRVLKVIRNRDRDPFAACEDDPCWDDKVLERNRVEQSCRDREHPVDGCESLILRRFCR